MEQGRASASRVAEAMSALPPKADKREKARLVRLVPKADSCTAAKQHLYSIPSSAKHLLITSMPAVDVHGLASGFFAPQRFSVVVQPFKIGGSTVASLLQTSTLYCWRETSDYGSQGPGLWLLFRLGGASSKGGICYKKFWRNSPKNTTPTRTRWLVE